MGWSWSSSSQTFQSQKPLSRWASASSASRFCSVPCSLVSSAEIITRFACALVSNGTPSRLPRYRG